MGLSHSHLSKLKSGIKNGAAVTHISSSVLIILMMRVISLINDY